MSKHDGLFASHIFMDECIEQGIVGWIPEPEHFNSEAFFKEDIPPDPTPLWCTKLEKIRPDNLAIDPGTIEALSRTYSDPDYDFRYDGSQPSLSIF